MTGGVAANGPETVSLAVRHRNAQPPDATTSDSDGSEEPYPRHSALSRQRKWAPRVRTGCLTCRFVTCQNNFFKKRQPADCKDRKRRVKCDETKPACMRCVNGGRACMGFPYTPASLPAPRPCHSPAPMSPTRMEQSLRHYFLTEAVSAVADEFNWELWHYYLPQASHNFQPIWHASNAVAAVTWSTNCRRTLAPGVLEDLERESARQYSASMTEVLALTQRPKLSAQDKTSVLLASILFAIYAGRTGDTAALSRIRDMNQRLILNWKFWECTASSPVAPLATQVLYHFVKGTMGFHESLFDGPRTSPGSWLGAIRWFQTRPLPSLMHAQIEAELLWTSICEIMRSMPFHATAHDVEVVESNRSKLRPHLALWEDRCVELAAALTSTSNFQVALLQVHRILMQVYFGLDLTRYHGLLDETGWDEFEAEFAAAIDILTVLLLHEDSSGMKPHPSVSHAAQAYRLLEVIARACRAPRLRRRAAVLQRHTAYGVGETPPASEEDWGDLSPWFITTYIIRQEEAAWRDEAAQGDCDEGRRCVRDEFVCNLHRVFKASTGRTFGPGYEECNTLLTVGDVLHGREGTKVYINYDE